MKSFASRRRRNVALLAAAAALLIVANAVWSASLHTTPRLFGWVLFSVVVFLALYNVRKKVPFLPLGSSASWLQLHIYAGLLSLVLFAMHVKWRVPRGIFEGLLALTFVGVAGSGIGGLILSRLFARRLTARGEEVIYERIPVLARRLQAEVEQLVLNCLSQTESVAVSDFYINRLKPFFKGPQNFWPHLFQSHRTRHRLLVEISSHERYLDEVERTAMREIAERVRIKDDLDFQFAHQKTLKYWLFLHIPLTYALLVFVVFHILLVYAYSGGIR